MKVLKPQKTTPNATASMAAVIRSTPRQRIRGLAASTVGGALREDLSVCAESFMARGSVIAVPSPVESAWLDASGRRALVMSASAGAQEGTASTSLRFSTPFAGANRSRFEGLRRTALSALWGAPLLLPR